MVLSRKNLEISYLEKRTIDPEDIGHESSLYEIQLYKKQLVVALGKPKYTFFNKNIIFFPIYIINKNDGIEGQIGIFEIPQNDILKIFDQEGDVDITKLGNPLLYEFSEKLVKRSKSNVEEYLRQHIISSSSIILPTKQQQQQQQDKEVVVVAEEENDDDDIFKVKPNARIKSKENEKIDIILKQGVFDVNSQFPQPLLLKEESESDASQIVKNFKQGPNQIWVQQFMKNEYYDIHEVESNGDCFFAVVRDAFLQIGHKTTIAKLRALLAKDVTNEIFEEYKTIYGSLKNAIYKNEKEKNSLKKNYEKMKQQMLKVKDNKEEVALIEKEMHNYKKRIKYLSEQIVETRKIIEESIGNMEGIITMDKFREHIQTSSYWADDWAIATIEHNLSVKMIIVSEHAYTDGAEHTVLKCNLGNKEIEEKKVFVPKHYIITSHSENHYRLVSYKNKKIFSFSEIPYHIKTLVVNKCIEKNSGIFHYIPDFRNFKSKLGVHDEDEEEEATAAQEEKQKEEDNGLYDPNVVFMFYNKSEKKSKPGKGNGEKISADRINEFLNLAKIDNWRRKLDDDFLLDEEPFVVDGHKYASVEHYYQSSKFKKGFPDFSLLFSLDTDNEISKDIAYAKAAGSKTGKIKIDKGINIVLRPKNVIIDSDFYPNRNKEERLFAVRQKFSQNKKMKNLLLETKNAKLVHYVARQPPEIDHTLMMVRKELI